MRIYHFGNFYMSSIQQGIQSAHAQTEMALKYLNNFDGIDEQVRLYKDWAVNYKTMICLNGGMNSSLCNIKDTFDDITNPYPWISFRESEEAMGGMLTNVAIVLPEFIYELASDIKIKKLILHKSPIKGKYHIKIYDNSPSVGTITEFQYKLINILISCDLAK